VPSKIDDPVYKPVPKPEEPEAPKADAPKTPAPKSTPPKSTPKSVRDRVYTGIAVRSAKDDGYELWVFPTERKFKLARLNGGSKPTFLAKGGNKAIKGRGKANHLGLKAVGSKIIAKANGKRLAKTVDRNAGQVDGRKVANAVKRRSKPAP
jgi:hypothetical protein